LDVRQLRYFIAVVEAGSFSRAAERLHVAQPALSQHVLAMEAELGIFLLHRSARGVKPTEEGLRLFDEARTIQTRISGLRDHVRGGDARPYGQVRFGMPGTVSEQLSVPLIEAAQKEFPDISLRIAEAMSGFVLDWLREGVVDIALLFDAPDTKGLIRHEALSEEIVLFGATDIKGAPKGPDIALQAALRLPLVLPSPSHGLRMLIDAAALAAGIDVHPSVEIDSYRQIKRLVARGAAFAILPISAIEAEVRSGAMRAWRLQKPAIRRRVILAYPADRQLSGASRAVLQLGWHVLRDIVQSGIWRAQWTGAEELNFTG
jgi:LysR family nitrogen assimilation transcriptional regulator